jgi:hypothetical protein
VFSFQRFQFKNLKEWQFGACDDFSFGSSSSSNLLGPHFNLFAPAYPNSKQASRRKEQQSFFSFCLD